MKKHIAPFVADAWFSETKLDKDKKSGNLPNMNTTKTIYRIISIATN